MNVNTLMGLRRQAQRIANETGKSRWINHTSLGWRIETAPSGPEELRVEKKPEEKKP